MNILHLLPTDQFGGAEKVVLQLAQYDKNNNLYVACGENLCKMFKNNNIKAYPIFINKKLNLIRFLNKFIQENQIDIIHAHDNTVSIISYVYKLIFNSKVKIISHIHNTYPWLKYNGIYKKIDKIFRNKYDFNIYCCDKSREHYMEYGKYIDDTKCKVVENGIEILPQNNENISKEQLEIGNKFIYGFIGRLDKQKGLIPFIKELEKNKHYFDDCKFVMIGDGIERKEIESLIDKLNLNEYFKFLGFQDNVYKFFDVIDILFLPSLYEGLPMVILEAMSSGKAIVSMDVGSINKVIKQRETGILVEEKNYEIFIQELINLKKDEELREKINKDAPKIIKSDYGILKQIEGINSIYNKLIL